MKKKTAFFLIGLLAVAGLFGAGVISTKHNGNGYQVGDKATDFSLKNIDGQNLSLSAMKEAKGFIVVFTCNHCPFSKLYEDRIIALDAKYKSQGYPVIAINPNDPIKQPEDSFDKMKVRASEKGFTFPYLFDETQEIARTYGAARTPHVFVLKKEKNDLIVKYIGAIDNNAQDAAAASKLYVEQAVDALASNKSIEEPFTKAIGCTIKWSE